MPQASAAACGVPVSPMSGVSGAGAELTWAIPIMASLVAVVAMASEHRVPSGEAFGGDGIGKDRCHFRRGFRLSWPAILSCPAARAMWLGVGLLQDTPTKTEHTKITSDRRESKALLQLLRCSFNTKLTLNPKPETIHKPPKP